MLLRNDVTVAAVATVLSKVLSVIWQFYSIVDITFLVSFFCCCGHFLWGQSYDYIYTLHALLVNNYLFGCWCYFIMLQLLQLPQFLQYLLKSIFFCYVIIFYLL